MKTNNELLMDVYDLLVDRANKMGINEDCLQQCFVEILLTDNSKLNKLQTDNELTNWSVGLCKKMWFCGDSKYHRLVGPPMVSIYGNSTEFNID